jgi:urease accessory protein
VFCSSNDRDTRIASTAPEELKIVTELPPGQSGLLYSMGFVIATGCLHAIGIALGLVNRGRIGKVALRAGGAFIALMGAYFVWGAIA